MLITLLDSRQPQQAARSALVVRDWLFRQGMSVHAIQLETDNNSITFHFTDSVAARGFAQFLSYQQHPSDTLVSCHARDVFQLFEQNQVTVEGPSNRQFNAMRALEFDARKLAQLGSQPLSSPQHGYQTAAWASATVPPSAAAAAAAATQPRFPHPPMAASSSSVSPYYAVRHAPTAAAASILEAHKQEFGAGAPSRFAGTGVDETAALMPQQQRRDLASAAAAAARTAGASALPRRERAPARTNDQIEASEGRRQKNGCCSVM